MGNQHRGLQRIRANLRLDDQQGSFHVFFTSGPITRGPVTKSPNSQYLANMIDAFSLEATFVDQVSDRISFHKLLEK